MNIYDSKILLVDDNIELVNMIADTLCRNGYHHVMTAVTAKMAMEAFRMENPQMVILDVMLPDEDGFSLFQRMREQADIPILFLSAKDQDDDRLFGLGLGADDYITKPFLSQELILRVGAVLKRTYQPLGNPAAEKVLKIGQREVSFDNATVTGNGAECMLTAKEMALLQKLAQNRGNIVTFDALCYAAWGDSYYGYENTLMVHIRHLREKLEEDPSHPKWLVTVRGLGYRLLKE